MFKNLLALIFGIIISIIILEVILNIYNPFDAVVTKGDKIYLRANSNTLYVNDVNEKLPNKIIYTTNSLGMRGPELSEEYDLKIITVGGSTTHSLYNSDQDTWPNLLMLKLNEIFSKKIWLNNAGISGHSTMGHKILVEDYLIDLQPDIIIFLVGINDIGRTDINTDNFGLYNKSNTKLSTKIKKILYNFEIIEALITINRNLRAKELNLSHEINFNLNKLKIADNLQIQDETLLNKEDINLKSYQIRLSSLINLVLSNNILPILITQSSLYGNSIDPITKIDLSKILLNGISGLQKWKLLKLYNEATISTANDFKVPYIDLENLIERNSDYYWDSIHYSVLGNKKVAEIISEEIKKIIISKEML